MKKNNAWLLAISGIIFALAVIYIIAYIKGYTASFPSSPTSTGNRLPAAEEKDDQTKNGAQAVAYSITEVANGLYVPWSIVFTSNDRLLVSERNGAVRVIENGRLADEPLARFNVSQGGEEGLMGMAIDPDYASNKRVYACLAHDANDSLQDKVISFTDEGSKISNEKAILDKIPAAANHAGCRLLFLPDGTLLVTTGDATDRKIAQDKGSLGGKILRINTDGSFPSDNPFPNSPIWSYGHRNPQGLAYDSEHKQLWEVEHGPSGFDGPGGGDEVNLIEKGLNYGWPTIHHKQKKDGLVSPLLEYTPAVAPSGMMYYSAGLLPQFKGNLFFAALKGEGIYRLTIDPKNSKSISAFEKLKDVNVGRVREIMQAPDGSIYFTTSNRDGRGKLRANDDKVYRIAPK